MFIIIIQNTINANFFVKKIKQVYYVAKSKRFISQFDPFDFLSSTTKCTQTHIVSTNWLQWKAAITTNLKSKLILIRHAAIKEHSITLKITKQIDK